MAAYYNENNSYAANWLRNLIAAGHIADGEVDERSIVDVKPDDLRSFRQCHFFAGIGGWSYALRLAEWEDDQEVWTGSCPCQPLSSAGKRKGHLDERHLWPAFHNLIAECKPPTVFGEQVASKDGREWLAGVRIDLEALGYALGAADLCAAGVGAPHIRQRIYWVANAEHDGPSTIGKFSGENDKGRMQQSEGSRNDIEGLGNASRERLEGSESERRHIGVKSFAGIARGIDRMGDPESTGLQGQWSEYRPSGERCSGLAGLAMQAGVPEWNGATVAVKCSDGSRRVSSQPDAFPLAHGISARMGKLRGAGNAINAPIAKEFIAAFMECRP